MAVMKVRVGISLGINIGESQDIPTSKFRVYAERKVSVIRLIDKVKNERFSYL